MPVVGVPVSSPAPGLPGDRREASPTVHRIYETPLPAKTRSVFLQQKTQPTLTWPLYTPAGDPVDLSSFIDTDVYEVKLAVRESMQRADSTVAVGSGTITDPSQGIVTATIPPAVLQVPGISVAEIVVREVASPNYIRVSNTFWLVVEQSLFDTSQTYSGPPSLSEVRLHLRDAPEGNRLLDDYEFDPAEVALAARRCVDWFNEIEPPLDQLYSSANFPGRYHWLEGIIAELFTTAGHYYRRNRFQYSAGGLQVSSIDKENEYMKAAQYHRERWETWARKAKIRANMDAGFLSWGSGPYNWGW